MYTITGTMGVLVVNPQRVDGWVYEQTAERVPLLSDGTSTHDEVIQQGSQSSLSAHLTGKFTDFDDVATLREYARTKEVVTFYDPEEATSHTCVVFTFAVSRQVYFIWDWDMTLVEASDVTGSGIAS